MVRKTILALAVLGSGALVGCASDSGGLFGGSNVTTSSVAPISAATAAPVSNVALARVDPACVALTAQIDTLRKEGVAERLEKASTGKTKTVNVKRETLAKMVELEKANAEFQTKCSTLSPKSAQTAAITPAVAPAAAVTVPTSANVRPVPIANQAVQAAGQAAAASAATTASAAVAPAAQR